jgi:hypothetical protein
MNKHRAKFETSLIVCIFFILGCGILSQGMTLDDERIALMLKAIDEVDRASLGFTPIPKSSEVTLEQSHQTYDVMLHIYSNESSRTIAFLKTLEGYRWIHEQEIFTGPHKYSTVDGTVDEHIVITYETERVSGVPLNQINIDYYGDDPRLSYRSNLTLDDVIPVIAEWKKLKK